MGAEKREKTYIASSILEVCLSTLVVHVRNVRWKFLGVLDEGVVGLLDLLYQPSITRGRQYSVLDHIERLALSLSLSCVSTAYLKRLAQIITFVRILNQLRNSISLLAEALENLFPLLGHDGWIVDR